MCFYQKSIQKQNFPDDINDLKTLELLLPVTIYEIELNILFVERSCLLIVKYIYIIFISNEYLYMNFISNINTYMRIKPFY